MKSLTLSLVLAFSRLQGASAAVPDSTTPLLNLDLASLLTDSDEVSLKLEDEPSIEPKFLDDSVVSNGFNLTSIAIGVNGTLFGVYNYIGVVDQISNLGFVTYAFFYQFRTTSAMCMLMS